MNLHEPTVLVLLLALLATVAVVACNDDQWPHV
jgi:hypothetical protein